MPYEGEPVPDIGGQMMDLHQYVTGWLRKAKDWRRESFESKWDSYRRDAEATYDPEKAAKKEKWQSIAFFPVTPAHRENIHAAIYKIIGSANPLVEIKPRTEQEGDQAQNIQDLILREVEKSKLKMGFDAVLADADTYGSGHVRIRFEEVREDRRVRTPQFEDVTVLEPMTLIRQLTGQKRMIGYQDEIIEMLIYRGIRFEPISIWDVFPDPKALNPQDKPIAIRWYTTYGDVVAGVEKGYYFPDAVEKLRGMADPASNVPADKQATFTDREIAVIGVERTNYGAELECYEWKGKLPKKWVYVHGEEIDDPEKMVPARVLFHEQALLSVEPNDTYGGECDIYKMDYIPVAGQYYGTGIPQMLKDIQSAINEMGNARQDFINLTLNQKFAVIERAVKFPKEDLNNKLGGFIRFDLAAMQASNINDVRAAFMPVPMPVLDKSAFIEPQELERYAQERTSANRVTMGTAGQVRDQNDTLGGMQMLRESLGDKIAYIGMMQEFGFLSDVFRAFWRLIYENINADDVLKAIGPKRAQTFQLMTPEQVQNDYIYSTHGVFTQESKGKDLAMVQSVTQQFGNEPWFDKMGAYDLQMKILGHDPDELKLSPEDMQQKMMAEGMMQMAKGPGMPGKQMPPIPQEPRTDA